MTVASSTPYIKYNYSGPGNYPFTFKVFSSEDVDVYHVDEEGVRTLLVQGNPTGYTLTLVSDGEGGGIVSSLNAATTGFLEISRSVKITQEVDWETNGALLEETLEDSFDRMVMIAQDQQRAIDNIQITSEWKGYWATGIEYAEYNIMIYDGGVYVCVVGHISGVFLTDLAAGYWLLMYSQSTSPAVVSAQNMLINAAFLDTCNQEEYDADGVDTLHSGAFGHDMWQQGGSAPGGTVVYTKNADSDITIDYFTAAAGGTIKFGQKNDELVAASGKQVTISFEVVSLSESVGLYFDDTLVATISDTGTHEYTVTADGTGTFYFGHTFVGAGTYSCAFRVRSLKAEEGSSSTAYTAPEPRAEELRCFYYHRFFADMSLVASGTNTTSFFYLSGQNIRSGATLATFVVTITNLSGTSFSVATQAIQSSSNTGGVLIGVTHSSISSTYPRFAVVTLVELDARMSL